MAPLKPETIAAHRRQASARIEANHMAAPGALADALDPQPVTVGRFTLLEMTAGHRLLLERIGSPFIAHVRELARAAAERRAPAETPFTDEQIYETLLVLIAEPREGRALWAKGAPGFREAACALADVLSPIEEQQVTPAIIEIFRRAFATNVEVVPDGGGTDTAHPTASPTSLDRSTASAGPSDSSPTAPVSSTPGTASSACGTKSP